MDEMPEYRTAKEKRAYREGYKRAKRGESFEYPSDNPYQDGATALREAFKDGVYEWQVYGIVR